MLKYDFSKIKVRKPSSCGNLVSEPTSPEQSVYAVGGSSGSLSTEDNNKGPDESSIEKDDSKIRLGGLNIENNKNDDSKAAIDQIESAKTIDLNKAMTDTMNNNFGNNLIPDNTIANNPHNEVTPPPVTTADGADTKLEKSPAAILEEKLRELTNKIAAAEQSLDKIKNNRKDEDSKPGTGATQDDLAKSLEAQIKQLKSELASAKAKAPTTLEKSESTPSRSIASASAAVVSASRESSDDRRSVPVDSASKREAARETSRAFADSSPNGAVANPGATSSTSTIPQSRVGGLVLTKVDGLSSDAAIETITAKITEMAGQPFLIEEGGFVKEIIPVIKDGKIVLDNKGKPIFEKIIKGKVADLKHKESKRAPASVSSQAELRKVEEAKVKAESERLKYKTLRELTDEAVK